MNEQTLMEIIDRLRNRHYGKYRGTVTVVDDGNNGGRVGRIKAKVPAVLGDHETGWCMPCVPYAGDKAGIAFLPEEGAGVWIEFEGGDVSYPIWVGCYWHHGEIPDAVAPKVKVIKTKADQQIVFDDDDHTMTLSDSNDNSITLDGTGISIVRSGGGSPGKLAVTEGKVSANDGAMEVT